MDLNVMVAIRDDRSLPTGYHKAILLVLATRGENAYPNQQQLMKDAGIGSKNTLIKTVKELQALGWLVVTKDKWQSNQYKNNRYQVQVPINVKPVPNIATSPTTNINTLKININKDKQKINILTRENNKWNHSDLSTFPGSLLPVSGIYNKGDGNG